MPVNELLQENFMGVICLNWRQPRASRPPHEKSFPALFPPAGNSAGEFALFQCRGFCGGKVLPHCVFLTRLVFS